PRVPCQASCSTGGNLGSYEKALVQVVVSRHNDTLVTVANTIETGLTLGLNLGEIQNYQNLIDQVLNQHSDLLAAEVLDTAGHGVFSRVRQGVPESLQWHGATVPTTPWNRIGPDTITLGRPVTNAFARPVGTLILDFSRESYDRPLNDIAPFMIKVALVIELIGTILAVLLGFLLIRPFNRSLDAVEKEVIGDHHAAGSISANRLTAPIEEEIRSIAGRVE
ncbi:MAG: hypothetical protein WCF85_22130, partial [Rhodospirillaceae bacterium]